MKRTNSALDGDEMEVESLQGSNKHLARSCPWLGTVERTVLDFDFEKVCSVTLQSTNIYACLVCGKYFQGRGRSSQAYLHSVSLDHHVFLNLRTKRFYCLPDDYEVIDSSLNDIKGVLDPTYSPKEIRTIDKTPVTTRTLDGTSYSVGIMGLNNVKANGFFSVVIQALAHIPMLRNFFLLPSNYDQFDSQLLIRFGTLLRRYWYPKAYKNHISPNELLQEVSERSGKKFSMGAPGKPLEFLQWFLNTAHRDLKGNKKMNSSIINKCFQGRVEVTTEVEFEVKAQPKEIVAAPEPASENPLMPAVPVPAAKPEKKIKVTKKEIPFLFLSADMPPPPLFPDGKKKTNIIPQESIFTLLAKFDGETRQFVPAKNEWRKFKITRLPRYLILHINRFTHNQFFEEKNPTIVNFPMKELDLAPYTNYPPGSKLPTKYSLLANIRHVGKKSEDSEYKVHVFNKSEDKWYDVQELFVEPVMSPSEVHLAEAFIQFYELQV